MDVMGNQVIHLVVAEIALFLPGIHESRNVVKSQAESLRRRPAWSKGCFIDLRRRVRLRVRESKTETILARGAIIFLTKLDTVLACRVVAVRSCLNLFFSNYRRALSVGKGLCSGVLAFRVEISCWAAS